jgi:hydroxymethylpyrimidine/phosphomethylpyrimidine kinase
MERQPEAKPADFGASQARSAGLCFPKRHLKILFGLASDCHYIQRSMPSAPPVVLTIAGFDPSCGAGVTADIKTIAAHGCYGTACITALTVQTTVGVQRVEPVSKQTVKETLRELAADMPPAAIRIGMLGSAEVVDAVAEFLDSNRPPNVVLDPIFKASSGAALLDEQGEERLAKTLLPLSYVVTPNIDEAAALTGLTVTNIDEMKAAARKLHEMGAQNVVVTGGHLERAADVLSVALPEGNYEQLEFVSDRVRSAATHGMRFRHSPGRQSRSGETTTVRHRARQGVRYEGHYPSVPLRQRGGTAASPLPHGRTAATHAG